ncbi:acyl-CoA-binding domain-containing protein 5 isoform X2 [Hermetia illucens]|uniref:acyl-CoA-binding domain-containing protein 5 isoform X2 n=1 Tax=Hermetia illucens TaxID=343691 RepID=UPI0018CC5DEA|nr:acyl-CoA-binding domain-containing protein 5 isoform X2 [Hermetia illucens]
MTSIEDRFNAAVNVIKSLPKNGSYQPSNAMMLTFYAYFKQGTQGPCRQSKPGFWDVVGRAKWDAWSALGDMSRERAMQLYVDELKKIIETMSYTENVANFMDSISELDGVNVDDLEAVAPEIMQKARSNPNSPFASRNTSPTRPPAYMNGYMNGDSGISNENGSFTHQNGYSSTVEQSDDEYIDTVDRNESQLEITTSQILKIVQKMNSDIATVNQRINALEKQLTEVASKSNQQNRKLAHVRKYPQWWPFKDISPTWFVILILWPFIVQRLGTVLQRKK